MSISWEGEKPVESWTATDTGYFNASGKGGSLKSFTSGYGQRFTPVSFMLT
jgi:hypothetical protein